jgi:hypothetical protein
VPGVVTRAASAASARGWGQTVFWRAEPVDPLPATPLPRARRRVAKPQLDLAEAEAAESSSASSRVPKTIRLESSRPSIPAGMEPRLIAHVSAASGEIPSGRVEFRRGRAVLGVAPLTPRGRASLSVRTLPIGTHQIAAHFRGDVWFAGSMRRSSPADVPPGRAQCPARNVVSTGPVTWGTTSVVPGAYVGHRFSRAWRPSHASRLLQSSPPRDDGADLVGSEFRAIGHGQHEGGRTRGARPR